jgi:hypothetical protein
MLKSGHMVSGHAKSKAALTVVGRTHGIHVVVPVAIRHHVGHAIHWIHAIPSHAIEVALVWRKSKAWLAHHTIRVHDAGFPRHAFTCALHCVCNSAGVL